MSGSRPSFLARLSPAVSRGASAVRPALPARFAPAEPAPLVDRHMELSADAGFSGFRDDGVALQVMANAGPGGRTIVQLTRLPDDSGRQRAQRHAHRMGRDPWQVLPPIAPPPHAEQYQEGGSSGEDRVVTSARIESDADLATLAAHYTTQLEKAGWQREDGGVSEPVAWSAWTFTDEEKQPWRALFVLLKWPGEPRRSWAQLVAEWVGERGGDGVHIRTSLIGWQTHTTTGTIGGS